MTEAPSTTTLALSRCIHCGEDHPVTYAHCPKTGKDITAGEALLGRVIAGKYRVVGLVGEGGMGAVYVAEHTLLGRKVAIKRLHPELAAEDKSVRRFQREARAAGATGHEHIVDVLDLGVAEDGAPFLVMEYLQGENLARVLQREGRIAPTRACNVLGQALDALAAVHQKGIIHRDLKPDNLFLTRREGRSDYVKVLDFGVSKMRREDGEPFEMTLTRTGVMVGTPYYMSPEQARGVKAHDHRVDLYAAGVILYQCLSGRLPFDAANYHALLQAILHGRPPSIGDLVPGLDPGLAEVVHRAIALDVGERFASAQEMLEALVPFGAPAPVGWRAPEDLSATFRYAAGEAERLAAAARPTHGSDPPDANDPARALALTPPLRRMSEYPVPFQAQSRDWDDARAPAAPLSDIPPRPPSGAPGVISVRPEAAVAPGAGSPAPRSIDRSRDARAAKPARVKGTLVTGALDGLRTSYGEDVFDEVIEALSPEIRNVMEGVILPIAWVSMTHYDALLRSAERLLGSGDGSIAAELGAAAAGADLPSTHRLFILSATPLLAVQRLPHLFGTYHDSGRVIVEPSTGGSWRLTITDLDPETHLHAMAMTGFYRRMLELTGARDAKAWLMSCRGRGDDRTVISLRWR